MNSELPGCLKPVLWNLSPVLVHSVVEPLQLLWRPAAQDSTHTESEIHQTGREARCESERGQCNKKANRYCESTASLTVSCQAPSKNNSLFRKWLDRLYMYIQTVLPDGTKKRLVNAAKVKKRLWCLVLGSNGQTEVRVILSWRSKR